MKGCAIYCNSVSDKKRAERAIKKDQRKIHREGVQMRVYARMLDRMLDHLDVEVEYGFITKEQREKILIGMREISKAYVEDEESERVERVGRLGAIRVAKELGLRCSEAEAEGDAE